MSLYPSGKRVFGRIVNTAVNAAVTEIVFTTPEGAVHAFAVGERLNIKSITINNRATAKDVTIFHDFDAGVDLDTNETLLVLSFAAAGFGQPFFEDGLLSKKITNVAHKFYAFASAAGAVDILVEAEVLNAQS